MSDAISTYLLDKRVDFLIGLKEGCLSGRIIGVIYDNQALLFTILIDEPLFSGDNRIRQVYQGSIAKIYDTPLMQAAT